MVGESLTTKMLMGLCVAGGGVVGMYFVQKAMEPSTTTVREILKKKGHRIIFEGQGQVTEKEREWFGEIVDVMKKRGGNFEKTFEYVIRYPRVPPSTEEANKEQKIILLRNFCEFSLGVMEYSEDFREAYDQSMAFCTHHDGNVPEYEISMDQEEEEEGYDE